MAETFNPILQEATVPTDEVGLFGRRKAQPEDPEFEDVPSTAIVIHQPHSAAAEDSYVLLDPKQGLSGVRLNSESRYFRIDLGERVIAWEFEAASSDADLVFKVKLLTVFAVTDPRTIAIRGVRDVRSQVRTALTELVRNTIGEFEISAGSKAAAAIELRLKAHVFDCGVEIRSSYAIVVPDNWSAERIEAKQEEDNRRQLGNLKYAFEQERDRFTDERDRLAQEHKRLLDEQRDRFKADHDRAQQEYELERRRLDEPRVKELERLKAEAELAKVEHEAILDEKREAARRERAQAERDAEHRRQQFEQQALEEQSKREADIERLQANHESELAKIRQAIETARESAELERDRKRHQEELDEATLINEQIANDPSRIMGFLLALGDKEPVRVALKMLEDRQKVAWERFKDLQKLNVLPESALRSLAISLMQDPAGGAFGLDDEIVIDAAIDDQVDSEAK